MAFQVVFKRYELKYRITREQRELIKAAMTSYMKPDQYGKTTIRNVYYDTDSYQLIRSSIERPVYKEKLRIRSYERADMDSTVFVELKKKYDHVVYKRRISLPEGVATAWVRDGGECPKKTQISAEIDYFIDFYGGLRPSAFISYDREAFFSRTDDTFRITFDENILCRDSDLSLTCDVYGTPIIDDDEVLMEVKCSGGIPLWLTKVLSEEKIYKTRFSKYGTAYKKLIFPELRKKNPEKKENLIHA